MSKTEKFHKMRQVALWLRWGALGGAVLAPMLLALALSGAFAGEAGPQIALTGLEGLPLLGSALIAALLTGLVTAALLALARMLSYVEGGTPFACGATRCFRQFALLMALAALAALLLPTIYRGGLAWFGARGQISLKFEFGDLLWLFLTLVFYLVAWLFELAAGYETDSRSIV